MAADDADYADGPHESSAAVAERADQLSPGERDRMLAVQDRMMARKPARSDAEVDAEMAEIRLARKKGVRRSPVR